MLEHAKYLLNRFDKLEADLASKERVTDADRHLVTFHVSSEAALDEKKLESKRDGSRVIDFDPETKEVVVDAPANLKTFIGKLRKYQESTEQTEAESLKNQPLIEAIDDLQLTPFEQVVGEALQQVLATVGSEKRTLLEFHCRGGYRNREEGRKTEKQLKEAFDCFDNLRFEDGHKVSFAEQEVYFFVLSGDEAEKLYDLTDCVFEVESSPAAALRWYYTESSSPDELEIEISPPPTGAPEVVVLNTGCRSEHTLLRSGLVSSHSALVNEESGGDLNGHGTEMCGLAFLERCCQMH